MKATKRKGLIPAALCAAMLTLTITGCAQEGVATDTETQEEVVATEETATDETAEQDEAETAKDEAPEDEAAVDEETTTSEKATVDEEASDDTASQELTYSNPTSNDTAVKGDYKPYDPSVEAEVTGGSGIEGSEEEQLQQERIAGGAAGAVVSENLEPLVGITDYSEGEYVPVYGISIEPPAVVHGDAHGTTCTTCHTSDGGAATAVPHSHVDQNLTDEDCVTCHTL